MCQNGWPKTYAENGGESAAVFGLFKILDKGCFSSPPPDNGGLRCVFIELEQAQRDKTYNKETRKNVCEKIKKIKSISSASSYLTHDLKASTSLFGSQCSLSSWLLQSAHPAGSQ